MNAEFAEAECGLFANMQQLPQMQQGYKWSELSAIRDVPDKSTQAHVGSLST